MFSEKSVPDKQGANGKSLLQRIGKSFYDSIGDIVFGMEDGTVSIFGLVFGVASSTTSSSVVLLAGATGAISAAVSTMADPVPVSAAPSFVKIAPSIAMVPSKAARWVERRIAIG